MLKILVTVSILELAEAQMFRTITALEFISVNFLSGKSNHFKLKKLELLFIIACCQQIISLPCSAVNSTRRIYNTGQLLC